jgi:hypothetical protein
MLQSILVTAIFLAACFYLGRQFWREFFVKKAACEGCAIAQLHQMQQAHSPDVAAPTLNKNPEA